MSESQVDRAAAIVAELRCVVDRLAALPPADDDAERIDRIAELERLRGAVAAAQARETTAFAASQLAAQAAAGVPARRQGRGIAEQVGLARKLSPVAAARQVVFAETLLRDTPAVLDLLERGQISEWSAQIVVRETTGLPRRVRRGLTDAIAPDLPSMSPRQVQAAVRRLAYEADPGAIMARGRTARADRHVSIRPAPDTMAVLSAFLPAEQGVAAWAALRRHAQAAKATGDTRTIGQLTADTLVERLTGQDTATAIPVEIGLTMTAGSLLDTSDTPAQLNGYGPIPADLARDLVGNAPGADDPHTAMQVWVRRLLTDPVDGTVSQVDSRRRRFDGQLARLIKHRDQICRDPFCTAPIRHLDHVRPHRDGGPTSADNGAGLCERGNYVKDMPGWTRRVIPAQPDGGSRPGLIEITTPTGHRYLSEPPPALGPGGDQGAITRRIARGRLTVLRLKRRLANLPPPDR
jgi:uncharacterized protein DUF222